MTDLGKRKLLVFVILAVIATGLFASALPQLVLKPGIPLPPRNAIGGVHPTETGSTLTESGETFMRTFLVIVLGVCISLFLYKIFRNFTWKGLLHELPSLVPISLIILAALVLLLILPYHQRTSDSQVTETLPQVIPAVGPPLGPLPTGLFSLVWIGVFVAVSLLGFWVFSSWRTLSRPDDLVILEAEQALQALRSGADFNNAIIRCYQQMSFALQAEQGIEKSDSMTAREFERHLAAKGIPRAPVEQLTQLFEAARYGNQHSRPGDEQAALSCLRAIVEFSRKEPRSK
jgi:hypothetical protein